MKKAKYTLIVLVGFPLLYVLNSFTPWSRGLFAQGDDNFYIPFWISVIALHWTTFFVVQWMLKRQNLTFKDIGFGLSGRKTALIATACVAVGLLVWGFTELSLSHIVLDPDKLAALPIAYPKTTPQRLIRVLVALSAGFCEELIYRGFAITSLVRLGMNRWLALIPAGLSFVFVHGVAAIFGGFGQFLFYFGAALVFGVIYLTTKRLLPGMTIHYLWDLMIIMAVFNAI